ncbi:MBL fold metallo-hydrolase [Alkalicoccobacillus murimartini]|uniref:Cft2 family RNA processing exonuclease n=1 Tax=Alkalicoccobacillus murimartini TaxID=171685 RepID=A0ABT9YMQ6_9BACI|nr:MBL fold metallo-hydrolase [Alkalicoccobacillus murimartini]MDQ0209036.1 Cft2 family RNA processing exonuclease [Alkalicoccobacillus murimartini]
MIDVTILGGVKEYGRNCFILTDRTTNTRIMLDCGVRNGTPEVYPDITEDIAQSIQAVFISHTHNDHIGALPLLVEKGFKGDVWMSEASIQQLATILPLWRQKYPVAPLDHLQFRSFAKQTRAKRLVITKNLSITWGYSGHMLGSIWYIIHVNQQDIFFSGDLALTSPLLVTDTPVIRSFDLALIDSGHATYTMPYKKSIKNILALLADPLEKYLIPITISGKACDLLFTLYQLLPDRTFFIDRPLHEHLYSYLQHPENLRHERILELEAMLSSDRLQIAKNKKQPGIYLLKGKASDGTVIQTGIYKNEHSPFYKSHPDREDLQVLVRQIDARNTIFFHSKERDLELILKNQPLEDVSHEKN